VSLFIVILLPLSTALLDLADLLAQHKDNLGFPLDMPDEFIFQFDNCAENKVMI
jgi:hypothetical protein